jgi:hypothetical protein
MRNLRGVGTPALGLICLLLIPVALSATSVTSFETGLPAGWNLTGAGGYSGPVTNLAPTDGSYFGWITTAGGTADPDLKHGDENGTILLSSLFEVSAPTPLSFDANFLSTDGGGFDDYAVVRLLDGTSGHALATLYSARTRKETGHSHEHDIVPGYGFGLSPGVELTPDEAQFEGVAVLLGGIQYGPGRYGGGPGGPTGWVHSSYLLDEGSYRLEFVVANFGDCRRPSALAMDNISLGGPNTGVPEPSAAVLAGIGILLIGLRRMRSCTTGMLAARRGRR